MSFRLRRLRLFALGVALAAAAAPGEGAGADGWRSRTVYQLLTDRFALPPEAELQHAEAGLQPATPACAANETYCGGTWRGIEARLDYITGMGFDAVWISPVPENEPNEYHGYAASNLAEVNPMFGTADDLRALVEACHARDVWVMVDVVENHMGNPPNGDLSTLRPFDEPGYFHSCGGCPPGCWIRRWQNQTQVELCRLDGLPDLNQSVPYVADTLVEWTAGLVGRFGFDGVRMDSVAEVPDAFWARLNAALDGTYTLGEVDNGVTSYVAPYQGAALDATLQYPLYWTMVHVFAQGASARTLAAQLAAGAAAFADPSVLGLFADNHDNPRMLSLPGCDPARHRNALALTLLYPGVPVVYQGTAQSYDGAATPQNRLPLWLSGYDTEAPMYRWLAAAVGLRKAEKLWLWRNATAVLDDDDEAYGFARGPLVAVLTNAGAGAPAATKSLASLPYPAGSRLCGATDDAAPCAVVGAGGAANVTMPAGGEPLLLLLRK